MSSNFDPQQFLSAQQTEVNEKRPPLPEQNPATPDGTYMALIEKVEPKSGTISKGDREGQPWLAMAVSLKIDVPQQLQDGLKLRPQLTLTDQVFIDLTSQGTIDNAPGRNRRQRDYREALDLNKPGVAFSWQLVAGQVVKVKLKHRIYEGEIQEDIQKSVIMKRA